MLTNPLGRLHGLDLAFALHGGGTRGMEFGPDQCPRAIFSGVFAVDLVGPVVILKPDLKIVRLANVELAFLVLEDVHPIHKPASAKFLKIGSSPDSESGPTFNHTVNPDSSGPCH
jgi:hypothetical protein